MKFQLRPLKNLEKTANTAHQWLAINNDPQFWIKGWKKMVGRHARISFQLLTDKLPATACMLYYDAGRGMSEATTILLDVDRDGTVNQEILLPFTTQALRLDPIAQPGLFSINNFKVELLARATPFVYHRPRHMLVFAPLPNGTSAVPAMDKRVDYEKWLRSHEIKRSMYPALRERSAQWSRKPLISVLMPTYNTPERWLRKAIDSVRTQVYEHWELCIADDNSADTTVRKVIEEYVRLDSRIKAFYRTTNGRISAASNSALELATGDFSALLDHDDELHPLALYCVAEAIQTHPDAALIYTDEDKISVDGIRSQPYFKSDFNYDLFLGQNMITHLGTYRTSVMREIGGFRDEFNGSQDYDLALRFLDHSGERAIHHIPRVLYHWREHQESTASTHEAKPYAHTAAMRAIEEHLQRAGVKGHVEPAPGASGYNKVCYELPEKQPSIDIIIPTRDAAHLVKQCVASIREKTTYTNYRITIIDNGSVQQATHDLFARLEADGSATIRRDDAPFNYSALNNRAGFASQADFICLMNNDIEVIVPEWLSEMVSLALQPGVGCVGAKLLYPNDTLQHAGVIIGIGGVAGHSHKCMDKRQPGYFSRTLLRSSMCAVTAACLVVRQSIFKQVGGLDEELQVAFNDVDFCLRVRKAGYRNVWTPYAELYHHESATRGLEDNPEKIARFGREIQFMQERWGDFLLHDPCYSPNLTLEHEDFSYAWPPRAVSLI
ncbi:glycosyl transferase family 2 [Trinickia symbiotica]|uniref:Glycosyl transferase family 2 n=1 Tax=Trinickia symbiotica TaxID=863227 RepID=A0A2T3XW10_9BURK|nr:glycosyltransferase family 2 protein [Trinickia symbiotica]PTB20706.1 glycosyl transferase family 2 [Trinickia symbiotica]